MATEAIQPRPRRTQRGTPGALVAMFAALLLLLLPFTTGHAALQEGDFHAQSDGTIRVGVYTSAPFVMRDESGAYSGMAIDLWEAAAARLGWEHEYIEKATFRELTSAVADGELDVAVTNLTITQARAEQLDFTHPWYDAGMRIMVSDRGGVSGRSVLSGLARSGHLQAYAGLAALALLATVLLTLFDRRFDPEFPRRWRDGLAESFYHVISVGTSGKTSRRKLFGSAGRVLAAIWMLCGVALVAYITSSVTSVMTTLAMTHQINGLSDLPGKTVGVLEGSTAEEFARVRAFDNHGYEHVEDAVQALEAGEVVAIVADAPVLEYFAYRNPGRGLALVGNTFSPEKYGFGVRSGAGIEKPLTVQLLGMQEAGYINEVRARYFGDAR